MILDFFQDFPGERGRNAVQRVCWREAHSFFPAKPATVLHPLRRDSRDEDGTLASFLQGADRGALRDWERGFSEQCRGLRQRPREPLSLRRLDEILGLHQEAGKYFLKKQVSKNKKILKVLTPK